MKRDGIRNFTGSILLLTLVMMIALGSLAAVFLNNVTFSTRLARGQANASQALFLAETGLHQAAWYLFNTAPDNSTNGTWRTADAYPAETSPVTGNLDGGIYTIWVEGAGSDSSGTIVQITSKGTYHGLSRTLSQKVNLLNNGLVAWWQLDEAAPVSGTTGVVDSSGSGYTGTWQGPPTSVTGKIDNALSFNGTTNYVTATTLGTFGVNLDAGSTLSFWVKTTTAGTNRGLIYARNTTARTIYAVILNLNELGVATVGTTAFWTADYDINDFTASISTNIYDGTWHHIVWVLTKPSQHNMSVYVDGVSKTLTTGLTETPDNYRNFNRAIQFGARQSNGTLGGYAAASLDDIRLYNRVLTSDEILRLYQMKKFVTNSWSNL